jgi:hypothetical protein
MIVAQKMKEWYAANEPAGALVGQLIRCLFFGLIVKREEYIVLAEPVLCDGERVLSLDKDGANCWWVYYCGSELGDFSPYEVMSDAPYSLPFVGFKRRKRTRIYKWDRIRRDIGVRASHVYA